MDTGVRAFIISMALHASIGFSWFALIGSMTDLSEAVAIDLSLQDYNYSNRTTVSKQAPTEEIQQKRCSTMPKQHEIPSRQPEPSHRQAESEHTATQSQPSPVTASIPDIQKQLASYATPTTGQEHQYSQPHSASASSSVANVRTVVPGKSDIGTSDTTNEQLQQHYSKEHFAYIRKHINDNIRYPRAARIRGQEGIAMVAFTIQKDGTISHPQIVSSSGHILLDEQAISAILNAAPFPRPPVAAQMRVPVVYQLTNS